MLSKLDIQRFDLGQPYYVALKSPRGTLCRNHSFLYNLVGGKVAFLPKEAHDEIQALHLDAGDSVKITRIRQAAGAIVFLVDRAEKENGPTSNGLSGHSLGVPSTNVLLPENAPESIRKPVGVATAPTSSLNTPQSQRIIRQLIAAIEVVAAAEQYARTALNREIQFDHADIRALAISGFIEQSRAA